MKIELNKIYNIDCINFNLDLKLEMKGNNDEIINYINYFDVTKIGNRLYLKPIFKTDKNEKTHNNNN